MEGISRLLTPEEANMVRRALALLVPLFAGVCVSAAEAGQIYGISYADISTGSTIDLTSAGTLDWVKWGNGETTGMTSYSTSQMTGSSIINPTLTPLGSAPPGAAVTLVPFSPVTNVTPLFTWTNGTAPMSGGNPVGTSVSETIIPAQFSYPLGLGLSFQLTASAAPEELTLYVAGFNTRMELSASLSGGGAGSLVASNAALIPVAAGNGNNYFSLGVFDVVYSGAGETLTIDLTAANQDGIPTNAPQYAFSNAGVYAGIVNPASVTPEPSTWVLGVLGVIGVVATKRARGRGLGIDGRPARKAGR
jgi:hypothetical protein